MRQLIRRIIRSPLRECRAIAVLSIAVGLDWMVESDSNFSAPVYEDPRELFDWVPYLHGMQVWGVMFALGGVWLWFARHWLSRLLATSMGVGSWLALGWVAGHNGFGSGSVSLIFALLCTYFSLRLWTVVMGLKIPFKEPPVTESEIHRVYVECERCHRDLPVPIHMQTFTKTDGSTGVETEPNMIFVMDHMQMHEEMG